jgi:hypothetical protein
VLSSNVLRCAALTARGTPCARAGFYDVEIGGRPFRLCGLHAAMVRRGSVTFVPIRLPAPDTPEGRS